MSIQYVMELFGTLVFAMSGALAATEQDQEHDWFGATFIGFVTAIGGGSLRDMLLGSYPLAWIADVTFLYAILFGIICAGLFHGPLSKLRRTFLLFDTIGISLFTVVGTEKTLSLGYASEVAAIMGMFSAVMGGVLRDTLINEIPIIFKKEIYASACLLGACLYLVMAKVGMERNVSFLASFTMVMAARLLAIKFNLSLPKFRNDKNQL